MLVPYKLGQTASFESKDFPAGQSSQPALPPSPKNLPAGHGAGGEVGANVGDCVGASVGGVGAGVGMGTSAR